MLLVLLAAGAWVYARSSGSAPVVTPLPSATPAEGVSAQVAVLERVVADAKQSAKPVAFTLSLTEADLTAEAAAYFPRSYAGVTLSDPAVRLRAGVVELDATARASFFSGPFVVEAVPSVAAGRPIIAVTSATIAGLPAPDSIRATIADTLQQTLDSLVPANVTVSSIVVASGTLTLQAVANP